MRSCPFHFRTRSRFCGAFFFLKKGFHDFGTRSIPFYFMIIFHWVCSTKFDFCSKTTVAVFQIHVSHPSTQSGSYSMRPFIKEANIVSLSHKSFILNCLDLSVLYSTLWESLTISYKQSMRNWSLSVLAISFHWVLFVVKLGTQMITV